MMIPEPVKRLVVKKMPFLWVNDNWRRLQEIKETAQRNVDPMWSAEARLNRCAKLLQRLFPVLASSGGVIESALHPADNLQKQLLGTQTRSGKWFIKGDHALPIVGSIKARGGFHEVLTHAEELVQHCGLVNPHDDALILASSEARALFELHQITVGSTGNLGLSVGVMATALGFQTTVHMSADAKAWKKDRLRAYGVEVIEHCGDYGVAVAAARAQARRSQATYFVDDERSEHLFWGYSVAAIRLKKQLTAQGVSVDSRHPLFVYLPCGVGGAPGGITFGLRYLFGDHVHCFFAEPAASPCMLIRLASADDTPISVMELGLDNQTEADGLAVGQASEFAARMVRPLVSGVFTVSDSDLFRDLYLLERTEELRVEPSAVAGIRGPIRLLESASGQQYLEERGVSRFMEYATHVLWTTGGAQMPEEEYRRFHTRGSEVWFNSDRHSPP